MYTYQSKTLQSLIIRRSQNSIILALIVHVILFGAFFLIKFEYREIQERGIAVSFMQAQQERLLRRSFPVREVAPINIPLQKYDLQPLESARVNNRLSSDFFINNASLRRVSDIREISQPILQETGVQKLKTNFGQRPVTVDLRDARPRQVMANIGNVGGHELIKGSDLKMVKPNIQFDIKTEDLMKSFLDTVRKKIESKKRYPESAKLAGIEGRSRVKLVILKNGTLENVEIIESSGHKTLDEAALQSVRDAEPFPPIPEGINKEKIEVSLYIVFKMT